MPEETIQEQQVAPNPQEELAKRADAFRGKFKKQATKTQGTGDEAPPPPPNVPDPAVQAAAILGDPKKSPPTEPKQPEPPKSPAPPKEPAPPQTAESTGFSVNKYLKEKLAAEGVSDEQVAVEVEIEEPFRQLATRLGFPNVATVEELEQSIKGREQQQLQQEIGASARINSLSGMEKLSNEELYMQSLIQMQDYSEEDAIKKIDRMKTKHGDDFDDELQDLVIPVRNLLRKEIKAETERLQKRSSQLVETKQNFDKQVTEAIRKNAQSGDVRLSDSELEVSKQSATNGRFFRDLENPDFFAKTVNMAYHADKVVKQVTDDAFEAGRKAGEQRGYKKATDEWMAKTSNTMTTPQGTTRTVEPKEETTLEDRVNALKKAVDAKRPKVYNQRVPAE